MATPALTRIVPHLWYIEEVAAEMQRQVKFDIARLKRAFKGA